MADAPTTSPQVKLFCNGPIRNGAQELADVYINAKRVTTVYGARALAADIPATDDPIDDGAADDGRPVISGNDVRAIITLLANFCADYEANAGAKLIAVARVAPNA